MIRNPGKPLRECALELGKAENTIYYITGTDLFKDYYAQRRAEWVREHDQVIRSKLTGLAELSLDATIEKLTLQRDKTALPLLTDLLKTSLDRLGFAPQVGPQVQINQTIGDNRTQVQLPGSVTAADLEEARMALRASQARFVEVLPPAQAPALEASSKGAEQSSEDPFAELTRQLSASGDSEAEQ